MRAHPEEGPYKQKHFCVKLCMNTVVVKKLWKAPVNLGTVRAGGGFLVASGSSRAPFISDFRKQPKIFVMGAKTHLNTRPGF